MMIAADYDRTAYVLSGPFALPASTSRNFFKIKEVQHSELTVAVMPFYAMIAYHFHLQ